MATIHDATLAPGKDELVTAWIADQRWYASTGARPRLRRLDSWRMDDPAGEVGIETLIYLDHRGSRQTVYQVPVTYRGSPLEGAEHALVGEMEHSVLGHRWVYDAPHDPVYVTQLLALIRGQVSAQHGSLSDTPEPEVRGMPSSGWEGGTGGVGRVLRGEQSNTSIVIDPAPETGRPIIVKVFRTLAAGDNPDIVLQGVLAKSPSGHVAASVGHLDGAWADPDGGDRLRGQLAFAQEYLAGAVDGWHSASAAAAQDLSFAAQARALGITIAEVHTELARLLPTLAADADEVAARVARMRRTAAAALSEVPSLVEFEDRIDAAFTAASTAPWPPLQRIHGDLHLGQVLTSPDRGWTVIDFEGEPLRALAERNRPDCPVRDVTGMLRSFDYLAASAVRGHPEARREWRDETREAFLDGYASAATEVRASPALLRAHLLDKALYEAIYESRHRPAWLALPVAAITALLSDERSPEKERA